MVVYLVMTETRNSNTNELLGAECRAVLDSEEKAKSYILDHLAKYDDNSVGKNSFYGITEDPEHEIYQEDRMYIENWEVE